MKICIASVIKKFVPIENFELFLKTLKKTQRNFFLCIVNNSSYNISSVLKEYAFENFEVIDNNLDINYPTSINQCLYYSLKENFDTTVYINPEYSIIVDGTWINDVIVELKDDCHLGGTLYYLKIQGNDNIVKILYSISPNGNIKWLTKHLNNYMMVNFVDHNIFAVRNEVLNSCGLPNSYFCDDKTYGMELSLRFLKRSAILKNIPSIYSSQCDIYRYDIFNKIKEGAKIVYPIIIDSVRKKFV